MKKTILLTLLSLLTLGAYSIGKQYDSETYEAVPVSVNTTGYEFGISYYRNNTVVFFRTDTSVTQLNDKKMDNDKIVLYQGRIASNGDIVGAEECEELAPLGIGGSFAYDKKKDKIYYSRYNKVNKVYQLYESTYKDGAWENPQPVIIENLTPTRKQMSTIVNANWDYLSKGASIVQPALAGNGNRLYFTSNLKGGEGKTDIWYINYNEAEDSWSAPVNVGKGVNTGANEQYPCVLGDSLLYYSSSQGENRYDLFVARLSDKDTLETENLGTLINASAYQYNLITTGNSLYYIAENEGTKDDIMFLKEKIVETPEPEIIAVVEPEPEPEIIEPKEFHHVLFLFDFDSSNLKPEFAAQLDQIVTEMKQFDGQKFEIDGHTDNRGSDAYNDALALRRAQTVYNLLVERGIDKNMLVVKSYGKKQPTIQNARTKEDHAQNRRVEITLYNENK